jgi:hypothetical protein
MAVRDKLVLVALRSVGATLLMLGVSVRATADQTYPPPPGYPPGWNVQSENLPREMCVFLSGSWGDTKRYWSDQSMPGSSSSRPLRNIQIIYQMKVGSDRYVEMSPAVPMPYDR